MKFMRIFTGPDNQSHLEQLSFESYPQLAEPWDADHVHFRTTPAGDYLDWHHAPRRQFVITLAGGMEIGLGDGSTHQFGPGDVLLAEDVTGQGHTRRISPDQPRISATIPID